MKTVRLGLATVLVSVAIPATPAVAAPAATGAFSVLSYNVAGLPEGLSSGTPKASTPIIGQRIRPYDVVHVQEDFNYHATLYANDTHPYRTPTSGGAAFGDGLNTLSHYPYTDLTHDDWNACNGTDCLTPKGFTWSRERFAEGVFVDFYNLHPNAGFRWTLNPGLSLSDAFGGPHGTAFTDVATVPLGQRVTQLRLRAGSRVDTLGLTLANGMSYDHGGTGGTLNTLSLGASEHLTSVTLNTGQVSGRTRVFSARFGTSLGRTLAGGSSTSSAVTYTSPAGWQISGFHGRSGEAVDSLGVIYTRVP